MMTFKELPLSQYSEFAMKHPYYNFIQSAGMYHAQQTRGLLVYCVGVVNEHNEVLAGTLLHFITYRKVVKVALADHSFLIDFTDKDVLKVMIDGLKEFLKKKGVARLILTPYYVKYDYDETQSIQLDVSEIENNLKKYGLKQDQRRIDVVRLVNLMFVKDLSEFETIDDVLKSFEPNLRRLVTKGLESGVKFESLNKAELVRFQKIENDNATRNGYPIREPLYYESMYDGFKPLDEIEFLMATLNIDEYRQNLLNQIEVGVKEIESIEEQGNLSKKKLNRIKSIEEVITGQKKRLKEVEHITQSGVIDLGGMMLLMNNYEMTVLKASQQEGFENFNAVSLLYYKAMEMAKERGIKLFNFYGTSDIDKPGSKGYQIYEYKKKFGGKLVELSEPYFLDLSWKTKLLRK